MLVDAAKGIEDRTRKLFEVISPPHSSVLILYALHLDVPQQ
jgi:peptide subunit release factor RF-3